MKKSGFVKIIASLSVLLSVSALSALEVDQKELQSTGGADTVVFINYTGPHSRIDSLASIKSIGSGLGSSIARSTGTSASAGDAGRYYVMHCVDAAAKDKLDADIMFIGKDATVDHIDNLRRIISAYLSSAYNYSQKDADTLAVFITVYNAVYRGKLDAYQAKYKDAVTKNLSSASCGLALSYKEWPGNTQIVIPLFDAANGGLSTVDTSVISDSKVVKSMQQDDGKNIESRKNMVDIKEREADKATEKAQTAQKKATDEQKKLDTEQQKNTQKQQEATTAQKEADQAKKEADQAQKKAAENPKDKQAQAEAQQKTQQAEQKQAAADEKKTEADTQQKKTDEQAAKADEAKNNASSEQAQADKKQTEAQNERTEIAKDQQTVVDKAAADAVAPSEYGMKLTDEKKLLSGMVKVNALNGNVIQSSPVTVIRNRTIYPAGNGFICIAGENSGNGAVKLVILDTNNMEITKESAETVAEDSVLVMDGADYYCVIQDGKNWVLGKYDANLTLKLKSPVSLKSSTPVTVSPTGIIVTGADNKIKLLSRSDLTMVTIKVDTSQAK
jgi:hypothetical protein